MHWRAAGGADVCDACSDLFVRNDTRSGLGGDAEECSNFAMTETVLTLSHLKILVVEASTEEDVRLGRCAGVWTLGPDNGVVLGQVAWLVEDMHVVLLRPCALEAARKFSAGDNVLTIAPWFHSVVGGFKKASASRTNVPHLSKGLNSVSVGDGAAPLPQVDSCSATVVVADRSQLALPVVVAEESSCDLKGGDGDKIGRRHALDDSEGEMCEEDVEHLHMEASAFGAGLEEGDEAFGMPHHMLDDPEGDLDDRVFDSERQARRRRRSSDIEEASANIFGSALRRRRFMPRGVTPDCGQRALVGSAKNDRCLVVYCVKSMTNLLRIG